MAASDNINFFDEAMGSTLPDFKEELGSDEERLPSATPTATTAPRKRGKKKDPATTPTPKKAKTPTAEKDEAAANSTTPSKANSSKMTKVNGFVLDKSTFH
jgi:hypothetical protein